jgi:filamentous hemagglutinin
MRPRRLTAASLIAWSLLSPTGIVWAGPVADAAVAGRTPTVTTTTSGQAMVNIATPNAAGLSYNRYQRFDVDAGGLLLNNSRTPISTALGTQIAANPNLGSRSAGTILNEVVTAIPSNLNGPLVVLGDSARIVIANPNGIACNGCAFVNTSHVSLTTGAVRLLDAPGGATTAFETAAALAFEVRGGRIEISGSGLAAPIDRLDLIAQTLKIGGAIDIGSGALNLIAGRQTVDHETLARIANVAGNDRASIGEDIAIDAALLGAMNAGSIRLIATATGMGVKSETNLAASSGDLVISASGNISLKRADAARNISIAGSGALTHTGMRAGNDLDIAVASLDNRNQTIAALGNTSVTAPVLDNRGGQLLAGAHLSVATPGAALELGDGTLMGGGGSTVRAASIGNTGSFTHAAALELIADTAIANSGTLLTGGNLTLNAATRIDNTGTLGAVGTLDVITADLSNSGRLQADGAFTAQLARLSNSVTGVVIGGNGSRLALTDTLTNAGKLGSTGSLELNAATLTSTGAIEAATRLAVSATTLNNSGSVLSHGDLAVTATGFTNSGGIDAENDATFALGSSAANAGGTLSAGRDLALSTTVSGNLGGRVAAGRDLSLTLGDYTHGAGVTDFLSGRDLRVTANRLTNTGTLEAWRDLSLTVSGTLANSGQLLAGQDIAINAGTLTNTAGTIEATRDLNVTAGSIANQRGALGSSYTNWGDYQPPGSVNCRSDHGYCESWAQTESTPAALLSAGRKLTLASIGSVSNIGSLITAGEDIAITANSFDNTARSLTTTWHGHWREWRGALRGWRDHDDWGASVSGSTTSIVQAVGALNVTAPTQTNSGTLMAASVYLGGSAVTNGLTDYRYATPANTLPAARIDLGAGLTGAAGPASLPGATFTPRAATLFTSASRLALMSLPAGSLNTLLPAELQNTVSPFLLDARLEQQAIREAALKETGQASFLAMNDPEQERAQLYANAARFAGIHGLHLGVKLGAEQIAQLTQPILWYESQTVTGPDGQAYPALVPRLYLPEASRESLAKINGGLIQAGTLDIEADGIRNTGYLSAASLSLTAARLTNEKRSADITAGGGAIRQYIATQGYFALTGDTVQPGGFISAATLNLNAGRIDSLGGEFLEGGKDASAKLQTILGKNFSQTQNRDRIEQTWVQTQKKSGLQQLALLVVATVVSLYTAGAASGLIASAAESSALASGATAAAAAEAGAAAAGSAWGVAASSAAGAMAANATTQLLTTGRLDGGQMLKSGATAGLTAGILNAPFLEGGQSLNGMAGIKDVAGTGSRLASFNFDTLGQNLGGMAARGVVNAGVNQLVYGKEAGSFGNAFRNSLVADLAAVGANAVGQKTDVLSVENIAGHAALGAAAARLTGKDAVAGAIGGIGGAVVNPLIDPYTNTLQGNDLMVAHLAASMLASGAVANALGRDGITAANAAQNETLNNWLTPKEQTLKWRAGKACDGGNASACQTVKILEARDAQRENTPYSKFTQGFLSAMVLAGGSAMLMPVEVTKAIAEGRSVDFAIDVLKGIGGIPERLNKGLSSDNPAIKGAAFAESMMVVAGTATLARSFAQGAKGGITGFSATESGIINEAQGILNSSELAKIQAAHAAGQPVTVNIGGRLVQYEPGLPASGMTMFGENGFLIGREAFASPQELQQTILHELYRLNTSSSASGVSGALATQETKAAADFAAKAVKVLK